LGIRSGNYSEANLTTNAYILDRFLSELTTNAYIVQLLTASLTTNADILNGYQRTLTTNATIIGTTEVELLTNAYIADLIALGLTTNAYIMNVVLKSLTTNASILGPASQSLTTNASICAPFDLSLFTNAYICQQTALALLTNAYISEYAYPELTTDAYIALVTGSDLTTNAYIVDMRYWAIGPEDGLIDISGHVYEPEPKGFGLRTSVQRVPGGRRVILQDGGVEGGQRSFTVVFSSDSARQAFQEVVNNDAEDLILYCGRSDRYQIAKKISVEPEYDDLWRGQAALRVTCELEDQYHYHAVDQGLDLGACPLPQDTTTHYNHGTVEAPLLFRVGGQYAFTGGFGGPGEETRTLLPHVICHELIPRGEWQPLDGAWYWIAGGGYGGRFGPISTLYQGTTPLTKVESWYGAAAGSFYQDIANLAIRCTDDRSPAYHLIIVDGATQEKNLSLGPALLSNEFCELTRDGSQRYYLTHTYYDPFDDATWLVDGVQSGGCSVAGGALSIPASCWFYLAFDGYPLKEDIELEATITTATSPIIQYSTDGATWITAIAASEVVSGKKTVYYLTGTEKKSKVYVRFYSPAGSSMTIQDINFTMLRDISAQYDQIPMVPVGESRALRVTGSGSSKAKIRTTFRSRWHAQ